MINRPNKRDQIHWLRDYVEDNYGSRPVLRKIGESSRATKKTNPRMRPVINQ